MPRLTVPEALRVLIRAGCCVGLKHDGAPVITYSATEGFGVNTYRPEVREALRFISAHPRLVMEWLGIDEPETDLPPTQDAEITSEELDKWARFWAWEAKRRG